MKKVINTTKVQGIESVYDFDSGTTQQILCIYKPVQSNMADIAISKLHS